MKKLFAVVVAWLVFSQSAFAELQIVVNSGVDSGRPVAVPQFKWAGGSALPEDVANVATFLGSDLSSYVSGQVIHCCGGMNM